MKLDLFWFTVSGLGTGIGILFPLLWWLVFPAIAVFVYAVTVAPSWRRVVVGGLVAGTIKIGCALGWIWTTYPIEWIDLGLGVAELPVIGFYWLTLAVVVGVGSMVTAIGIFLLRAQSARWWWGPVVVVLWLTGEVVGALCFSLFTWGEGGTVNALFSFGMVGNLLSEHEGLLQVARLGGVYALSAVAVAVAVWLLYQRNVLLSRNGRIGFCLFIGLLIVTAPFSPGVGKESLPGTVAIVDTRFGGEEFFALEDQAAVKTEALEAAVMAAKATGARYIVLPEGVHVADAELTTPLAFRQFMSLYEDTGSVVIESARVRSSLTESSLRGRIYDEQARTSYTVDKQRLVPQGEFMPTFYVTVLSALGMREAVTTIEEKLDYRPGPYVAQISLPGYVPSVLFCFAEADPLSVRRFVKERDVPFVANPISHAWFHTPQSLWWQYDAMRKIHAVWNQVSIVTAGNMSAGAWYTTKGEKVLPRVVATGEYWTVSLVP
jgi:apolipoprotein N-acyltransferase